MEAPRTQRPLGRLGGTDGPDLGEAVRPFLVDVVPSPRGDFVACAYAGLGSESGMRVQRQSVGDGDTRLVGSFASLYPVSIACGADGTLACAQLRTLCVHQEGKDLSIAAPGPIRALEFDAASTLWGVSDSTLWEARRDDGYTVHPRSEGVLAFCADPILGVVERDHAGLQIVYWVGGEEVRVPWPLSAHERPSIQACHRGRTLFVAAERTVGSARVDFEFAALDAEVATVRAAHDFRSATGLGWPPTQWQPWLDGRILATLELDEYFRVYSVGAEDGSARPVTPSGCEVAAWSASPEARAVAVTGRDHVSPGLCEPPRLSVFRERAGGDWSSESVYAPVATPLSWDRQGLRLYYARSLTPLEASICVYPETDAAGVASGTEHRWRCPSTARRRGHIGLSGPSSPRSPTLVCVQGPHRRFGTGSQSTFFHHVIVSMLNELARAGYAVICMNGPGSSGVGRRYREPSGSWLGATVAALDATVQELRSAGANHIGLVAGSLGALPTLDVLARDTTLAAAVLISPVTTPHIPPLKRWQHLFTDADSDPVEGRAARIRSPLLIFQGLRDEMTDSGHTSRLIGSLPETTRCDYLTLHDEGHIYREPSSWETVVSLGTRFVAEHISATAFGDD